tara:strand:+ start:3260 stop:4225 length:966 start_codon:yes stop_codon:yes gene_type:complete
MINLYKKLYRKIYKIRQVEKKISEVYKDQEIRCPVHLSIGQEAVAAGVCEALSKKDEIISTHRSHAHYLAKGGNLKNMMAELYGKKGGCAEGLGGSMHLQDISSGIMGSVPIVGSTIPIGVGMSFYSKFFLKNKNITTIFFGEGATEEGVFHECINFASLHSLPILFICENNLYSVYTELKKRQSNKRNIKKIVQANGIESYSSDGNNVLKVYSLAKKSIAKIKKNKKPIFLEFKTYRWLEHCGPNWDDHLNYRPKGELKKWLNHCPLKKLKNKITQNSNKLKSVNNLEKKIDKEVIRAFNFAKINEFPKKNIIEKYIYSN